MARSDTLAPGFLVASPRLDGSVFERAVVVMIHHDEEGAMGFIINKPLDMNFGSLLELVELEDDVIEPGNYEEPVYFGGPVRVEQLWVIHHDDQKGAAHTQFAQLEDNAELHFHDEWTLSGTVDSIEGFASGVRTNLFRPYLGYAGWGPGQLEDEIGDGSWLLVDFDEELVFGSGTREVWDKALARLGLDETTFMLMGKGGSA